MDSSTKQSPGMLKLVAMGKKQVRDGETKSVEAVFDSIEKKLAIKKLDV
ncbi:MAG: hypothetical protein GY765_37035 [bacterium]|nr:hypothetical protein [bacterium]